MFGLGPFVRAYEYLSNCYAKMGQSGHRYSFLHIQEERLQSNGCCILQPFCRCVRWLQDSIEYHRIHIQMEKLTSHLNDMEQQSAVIGRDDVMTLYHQSQGYLKKINSKVKKYQSCRSLQEAYSQLRIRVCSLHYRINSSPEQGSENLSRQELDLILNCKTKNENINCIIKQLAEEDQGLTDQDCTNLSYLKKHYPQMASLVFADQSVMESYVRAVVLRELPVDVFVQFFNTSVKSASQVLTHFGHFKNFLKVEFVARENWKKRLTFPYITQDENGAIEKITRMHLFDSQAVLSLGSMSMTVGDMLEVLKKKPVVMGPLEVFPEGIRAFHSGQFGWSKQNGRTQPFDVSSPDWYKRAPVWLTITTEEANQKYGKFLHGKSLDGSNFMVALCVSAKNENKDLIGIHGYQLILAPMGDGSYKVFLIGKLPRVCPDMRSVYETLHFAANTVLAEVQYDNNFFNDQRVHGQICNTLSPEQGQYYMHKIISREIQKGRDGKLLFQFGDNNCTAWLMQCWRELRHQFPELQEFPEPKYSFPILEANTSHSGFKFAIKIAKAIGQFAARFFIDLMILLLGATRGFLVDGIYHSLWSSRTFTQKNNYPIYNPIQFFDYGKGGCPQQGPTHKCIRRTTYLQI